MFEYEEQKIGRKVDRIIVTIRANAKGSNDYQRHRKAFIEHMRANYVNADVLSAVDKYTQKSMIISITPDGKLYDKKGTKFDSKRSDEMWDTLFEMSQEDELLCVK